MLINLSKSVPLKELCRITAIGHAAEPAEWIEFTISHEAMVGFTNESEYEIGRSKNVNF